MKRHLNRHHAAGVVFGVVATLLVVLAIHTHGKVAGQEEVRIKVMAYMNEADFLTVIATGSSSQ